MSFRERFKPLFREIKCVMKRFQLSVLQKPGTAQRPTVETQGIFCGIQWL